MTLKEFLEKKNTPKNLIELFEVIKQGIAKISEAIKTSATGVAGTQNIYGEKQLALDVLSNEILAEIFKKSGLVKFLASEEIEDIVDTGKNGAFTVVFDPLDGSSLVDANFALGSIFGIYPPQSPVSKKPKDQIAAAFAVYGPRTTLVLTVSPNFTNSIANFGVHEFLMNKEFYLSKENLKVSEQAKYFAPGNLRACKERKDYLALLNYWAQNGYTLRYSGGMVPDLNHIFLKGNGIFSYPPYSEAPEGKLRLLFECGPMAFLMESAGGSAIDGKIRILDKEIKSLHQRTPIFIGSKKEVERCQNLVSTK